MNKKLIFYLAFTVVCTFNLSAQLVNNGATITIEDGATLYVEGDVDNINTGTITNNGTLEIQGDLTSEVNSILGHGASSVYIFSGSNDSNIDVNDEIGSLQMKKTNADVVLMSPLTILTDIEFINTANKIILGNNDLTMADGATTTAGASDRYIVADAAGKLKKEFNAAGSFKFEVGDMDDYTPLTSVYTGGSGSVSTNVVNGNVADVPCQTDAKISRSWNVTSTGGISQSLTGAFASSGDVTLIGGASNTLIKGAIKSGSEWFYINSIGTTGDDVGVDVASSQSDVVFTGTNIFGKLNAKVFLQGPTNGAGTSMSTDLNAMLPDPSPYTNFSRASTPSPLNPANDDILATYTDWLEIEARNAAGTTVLSTIDAFVTSTGTLKDVCDNTLSFAYLKDAPNSANIGIGHRNHLGVRTVTPIDLTDKSMLDFTTTGNIFDASNGNTPMAVKGSSNVLWGGDVNHDGIVYYTGNGNDRNALLTTLAQDDFNYILDTYSPFDVNMDGLIYYTGNGNDRNVILSILDQDDFNYLQAHN